MHVVQESSPIQSVVLRSAISELLISRVGQNGLEIRSLRDEGSNRFGLVDANSLKIALATLYPESSGAPNLSDRP